MANTINIQFIKSPQKRNSKILKDDKENASPKNSLQLKRGKSSADENKQYLRKICFGTFPCF